MQSSDEELVHRLKIKFGLAPYSPNSTQLLLIKRDISLLILQGKTPTYEDWYQIVGKYCPEIGTHRYLGLDNSDLITLMQLVTKK